MISIFEGVLRLSASAVPVILAVAAVRLLLNFAPRKYSYALWGVVAFRLCIPFSFKSPFSLLGVIKSLPKLFSGNSSTAYVPVTPPMESAVVTLPEAAAPSFTLPVTGSVSTAPSVVAPAVPEQSFADILPSLASAVWVLGVIAFLVYGITAYMRVKRLTSDAVHMGDGVYESERVTSPFVLGVICPRIYIPESLDIATRELVISHERFHIRRCDHVIKLLAYVILSLHWFNPLCYLAFALMSRDMEMSCDEKVLASVKKDETYDIRKEYSMAILKTASEKKSIPGPVAFGGISVKNRVVHALNFKKPRFWVSVLSVIICAVTLLGCAANAPTNGEYGEYVPKYEALDPVPLEITPLDDAVTRALLEFQNKGSIGGGITSCESHAIVKTIENKDESTVSVIVLRDNHIAFDPMTGYKSSVDGVADLHIIKFEITENGYERRNFMSDPLGYLSSIEGIFGDFFPGEGEDALKEFLNSFGIDTGDYEMTPFRYEKDGKLYEADDKKKLRYYESLIAAVLDSDESYDDPEGYITENSEAFEALYKETEIIDFLIEEFRQGGNDDLRGYVMYRALEEYLKYENETVRAYAEPFEYDPTDENGKKNGQKYFDAFVEAAVKKCAEEGYYTVYCKNYRTWIEVFMLFTADMTAEEYASLGHMYPLPDKITVDGEKKFEFTKGEEKYYELFKCASWFFFDTEWAKNSDISIQYLGEVSGLDDPKVEAVRLNLIWDVPAVELVYDDGKSGYIVADGGYIVLIQKESDSGEAVYDAYFPKRVGYGLEYYLRCNFREE